MDNAQNTGGHHDIEVVFGVLSVLEFVVLTAAVDCFLYRMLVMFLLEKEINDMRRINEERLLIKASHPRFESPLDHEGKYGYARSQVSSYSSSLSALLFSSLHQSLQILKC